MSISNSNPKTSFINGFIISPIAKLLFVPIKCFEISLVILSFISLAAFIVNVIAAIDLYVLFSEISFSILLTIVNVFPVPALA